MSRPAAAPTDAELQEETTGVLQELIRFNTVNPPGGETPAIEYLRGILEAAALITVVGALDDVFDLSPLLKLLGQVAAAVVLVEAGVEVSTFTLPFIGHVDVGELAARFGTAVEPKLAARAEKLGLVVPLGDGRYEIPSPTLLAAGEAVVALGVPLETALDLIERVGGHADAVSKAFVRLFMEQVWKPFTAAVVTYASNANNSTQIASHQNSPMLESPNARCSAPAIHRYPG